MLKATKISAAILINTTLSALFNLPVWAQSQINESSTFFCGEPLPQAVALDSIVPTLYQIVSGPAGSKRDWKLMHQLFAPTATITPVFHADGQPKIMLLTVDEFVALNEKLFKDIGFFETEVDNQTIQVGHMATVISLYESREAPQQSAYSRGINSFQLLNDGRRWCVISVTWDSDKGSHFIPNRISPVVQHAF